MTETQESLAALMLHNHAGQLQIAREVQRKNLGLSSQDVKFPGTIEGNTINHFHIPPTQEQPTAKQAKKRVSVFEQQQPDGTWVEIGRSGSY